MNKIPKDPWGGEYIYVPQVDWNRLVRLLNTKTPRMDKLEYYIQAIKKYKNILEDLPKNVEPMVGKREILLINERLYLQLLVKHRLQYV